MAAAVLLIAVLRSPERAAATAVTCRTFSMISLIAARLCSLSRA
jgi:hypothetical protein